MAERPAFPATTDDAGHRPGVAAGSTGVPPAAANCVRAPARRAPGTFHATVLLVVLLLAYGPILFIDFGIHNDYRVRDTPTYPFAWWPPEMMLHHVESIHLCYVCRPLNAVLFNLHQSFFPNIRSFAAGRLVTLLTLAGCALAFFCFAVRRLRADPALALTLTLGVFTLPSFLEDLTWLTNYVPGMLNLALVTVVYLLLDASDNWFPAGRRSRRWPAWGAALLLLVASHLIYSPTAMFVFAFPFAAVLLADRATWPTAKRRVIRDGILGGGAMALYYVLCRWVFLPLFRAALGPRFATWDPVNYAFSAGIEGERIARLLQQALFVATRLWSTDLWSSIFPPGSLSFWSCGWARWRAGRWRARAKEPGCPTGVFMGSGRRRASPCGRRR